MKKKILLVVLAVVMLSFVGCNRNENPVCCEEQQGIITGRLGFMPQSCPIPPPDSGFSYICKLEYLVLRNDAGTFVLRKDGKILYRSFPDYFYGLGNFSENDMITICGSFHRFNSEGFWVAEEHYVLTISRIIR